MCADPEEHDTEWKWEIYYVWYYVICGKFES